MFIRKRKRAYRKAKRTNLESNWKKLRKLQNRTITMIRDLKLSFYDKIGDKLKCETLSSKDWWSTLIPVIALNSKSIILPLTYNDHIFSDERDKANILNDFSKVKIFRRSKCYFTWLTALCHLYPAIPHCSHSSRSRICSQNTNKASCPNELSNRILRELSCELSSPFCSFLTIL